MANLFSTVVGDRIASTAASATCQTCYCTSAKESSETMGKVSCFDCEYPRFEQPRPDAEDEASALNLLIIHFLIVSLLI